MPQNIESQVRAPLGIDDTYSGVTDELASEEESTDDREAGAEAMNVSLKRTTHDGDECIEVYAHRDPNPQEGQNNTQQTVLLARVTERKLDMFPLVSASYRQTFLKPKYNELTTITVVAEEHEPWPLPETISEFDALLESLPVGFGRHAKYGLGFKWEYRLIPHAILEMVGITELMIEPGDEAFVQLPRFHLGIDRFSKIKRSLDSITHRLRTCSLRERQLLAYIPLSFEFFADRHFVTHQPDL
ncbi:hypothetical protein [Thiobaca trueperi]|uniref:Uncharacterized protein n=1 Tax=Thiobaca trueperi TaxID=127458 RepID=A0A4R3MX22_9GAMM|nr:hypothetical protein [Thiobaca trueperi]TCT21150.1 hypothetical protein EDC35_1041 [Thiobaca trueperi]